MRGHLTDKVGVGEGRPAVTLHRGAVDELAGVVGIGRALQELLHQVDRVRQVEVVHFGVVDADLADQVRADPRPVLLGVVAKIVAVVAHVVGHLAVDDSGVQVPQPPRIAVLIRRPVGRVPGVELSGAPPPRALRHLQLADLAVAAHRLSLHRPLEHALGRARHRARHDERAFVLVDVDQLVAPEVDRIGVVGPRAAVVGRVVEHLGERDPAAGRTAGHDARVRLADQPEVLLDVRDQLFVDGVAVGSVVGRVEAVGVVEVGRRMLQYDRDHAWEVVTHPCLREFVARLAHATRLSPHLREQRIAGRRLGGESEHRVQCEVPLLDHERVAHVGVLVEAARQQHDRAQVHGVAPPTGKDVALDPDALHPLRVGRHLDRGDLAGELELDHVVARRIDPDPAGLTEVVARRECPALPLPLVLGRPDGVSVGALVLGVDVQDGLDPVIAGGQAAEAAVWVAVGARIDDHGVAGGGLFDVGGEEGHLAVALAGRVVAGDPGLGVVGRREDGEQAAGKGAVVQRGVVGDLDTELGGGRRGVAGCGAPGLRGGLAGRGGGGEKGDGGNPGGGPRERAGGWAGERAGGRGRCAHGSLRSWR